MGQGGRAVLDALASGESDPERLADQVRTKVRASRAALVEALRGRLGAHQRVVLRLHLAQADAIEAAVAELDRAVGERLAPFCDDVAQLSTMPGLSSVSASAILSEIGSDTFCQPILPFSAISSRWRSRCVGAVSAVALGTAVERGGTTTSASGWRSATSA